MNNTVQLTLKTDPGQRQRLEALQQAFAQACNALAPVVQRTRCWNRVALHHMAYKGLRQAFPGIGSQMACNAIYSVSRACRQVYQHPDSPFNIARMGDRPLPLLQFTGSAPVYFDRHTLSIKDGKASMFTLDGRMHFKLDLPPQEEQRFRDDKLREIVLSRTTGTFVLTFVFADPDEGPAAGARDAAGADMPEYVVVAEAAAQPAAPLSMSSNTAAP
jgi:hypothetical protein